MKAFDMKRFGTLLRCHLHEQRHQLLTSLVGVSIGMFLVTLIMTKMVNADSSYADRVDNAMAGCFFASWFVMLGWASSIFQNVCDVRKRTTFLMLPATTGEKYLVRLLFATVVMGVVTLLAIGVADVARMAVAPLQGEAWMSGVARLLREVTTEATPWRPGEVVLVGVVASLAVFTHAFYVLGGALFRRQPFILTTVAHFVLSYAVLQLWHSPLLNTLGIQLVVGHDAAGGPIIASWAYALIALCLVLAVLCHWLAYRVFARMPLVTRKYLNL